LRGEDGDDLDWAAFESAGFASAGEEGAFCAAAAAGRIENIKTAQKILFMLDLTMLKLVLSDLILLELILFELRALPGSMITWMLDRREWGALILTRYRSHWGKTLRAAQAASKTEVLGPRGLAGVDCQVW
jgi:hypothetical protein